MYQAYQQRVLEIGFGPGLALEMMSTEITNGIIFGIDHSSKMLFLAEKRNSKFIKEGKLSLFCNSIANMPLLIENIDKVLDINSFQFWKSPVNELSTVRTRMKPGAIMELVHQPRKPGATV